MKKIIEAINITTVIRSAFFVFAISLGAIVVSFELYRFVMIVSPPMKYIDVHIVTPEVQVGGTLFVSYTLNRSRFCRTEIDRFILRDDEQVLVWRDTVPGGVGDVGKFTIIGKVSIPANIIPGAYKYVSRSFAMCQEGMHMTTHPRLKFRVVK